MANLFNFPYAYHMVNTYTGEDKWVEQEEKEQLEQDSYWECDNKVIIYPNDWI